MDADLLEQLYKKYYSSALLYCISLCGSEHLAKDFVADAFVKAYLSLPDDVPSFRYWLLRVCKNLWIDHLRAQQHLTTEEALQYIADPVTPETVYLTGERNRKLWEAIGTLSSMDKELVILHYFSGLPLQEIARMLGKSYASVRQRMVRLRNKLKEQLEEQGYGYEH